MEVNSATATSLAQLVNSQQPQVQAGKPAQTAPVNPATAPAAPSSQPAAAGPESTVVKLSEQSQQLNRSEQNVDTKRAEVRPQEVAEPPGIRFMEESSKVNGRINTYA